MNLYPNRHGTKINIGFTFNNKTHWFMHAEYVVVLGLFTNLSWSIYYVTYILAGGMLHILIKSA